MRSVLIRNLPDDVHAALVRQARRNDQSLQQYLAAELRRIAERPSVNELLDRVERREGGGVGLSEAVDDLTGERLRR